MAVNMISRFSISWGSLLAGVILLGGCSAQAPGGGTATPKIPAFDEMAYMEADIMAGGLLYDKWWGEGSPPGNSNPMITATGSTTDRDGESWRCVYCHAWDYNGTSNRGFVVGSLPGNLLQDMSPKQVYNSIVNGTVTIDGKKKAHKFFPYINAAAARDLTKFLLDPALRVDTTNGGNSELGKSNYTGFTYESFGAKGCEGSTCHKVQANKAVLLKTAAENPTEFIHKVRFGNANTIMPGGPSLDDAINILAYVRTLSAGPAVPNPVTPAFDNARYSDTTKQLTDLIQGGLLYDKWWDATVPAGTAPTTKHPLWPSTASTRVSTSSTWRCKQCHGWDYRGADGAYKDGSNFSGIGGIIPTNSAPVKFTTASDVFTFIKSGTNHAFGLNLADGDIYGLTRFVMTQRDLHKANKATFHFIDDSSLATIGTSISNGGTLFTNNCETCHDADGTKIDFADKAPGVGEDEFVDTIAKDNPWELMHKVLYGHPGSAMPALFTSVANPAATATDAADILAYAQTSLVPDVKRGGRLYDKWWDENSAPAPTTDQAIWASRSKNTGGAYENTRSGADSWRCKECHGWDYKGASGAYGSGSHKTGFTGVLNRSRNSKDLVEQFIRSGANHVFAGNNLLSERDVRDLGAFIMDSTKGVTDVSSALTGGNTNTGKALYDGVTPGDCKGCHGAQGTTVPNVDLGFLANDNPPEFVHKARFGNPGSSMVPTAGSFTGLGLSEAGDVRAYAKTITATSTPNLDRGGRLFDEWWAEMAVKDPTVTVPTAVNPMWATRDAAVPDIAAGKPLSATWRCKTCHGWNYRGVGFTRTSGIVTSKDDLLSLRIRYSSKTELQLQTYIADWIKNGTGTRHNFGVAQAGFAKPLTDADIADLTKFLLDGVVDTSAYLSSLGGIVTTDPAASILNGDSIYNGAKNAKVNCSSCHGADGVTSPPGTTAVLDILDVAKNEATEFFHKVRFGQPGTDMPAMLGVAGIADLITANKEARDTLGYAQDVYCKRIPKPTGC